MLDAKENLGNLHLDCKLDTVFRNANLVYTDDQLQAIRLRSNELGFVEEKLIGWAEKATLVWGYAQFDIAQELGLTCDIEWRSFASHEEALAEIAERMMLIPTLTLFAKIEVAKPFGQYWQDKYDREHLVCKEALHRFNTIDSLGIVAVKAGTSRMTVHKVNVILESHEEALIAECREGNVSITAAYERLKPHAPTANTPDLQTEIPGQTVLEAEHKRTQGKNNHKNKEVSMLCKYSVVGFSDGTKLNEQGRLFFIKRWNDEHPDSLMSENELEEAIAVYNTDNETTAK